MRNVGQGEASGRWGAAAAALAVVASLAAVAPGAAGQEGAASRIAALRARGLHGDAMHACDDALPSGASDGALQLVCAQVYVDLYRLDDGERCGLAATELLPTQAAPLVLVAASFEQRGDDETARGYLQRALALEPTSAAARATLERVVSRRATPPEPDAASPAHVVWSVLEGARAGRLAGALLPAIDAGALVAARRAAHLAVLGDAASERRRFVDAVAAGLRERGGTLAGYAFVPGAPTAGDEAEVAVELHALRRPDLGDAARLARRLEAPPGVGELPLAAGDVYRSLAEADRLPYLRRRANLAEPFTLGLRFDLRRAGGAWRIVDFRAGDRTLAALLRELDGSPALVAADPAREPHPTTMTTIVAIAAGVGFVVYMLLRRRATS